MDTTTKTEPNIGRRQRPRLRSGPYAPAPDPIADARAALGRGVAPRVVALRYLPPIIRRRLLASLRALLAEHGAEEAFEAALAELERRAAA